MSPEYKYQNVARQIRDAIGKGIYQEKLPDEEKLAQMYRVSRGTIREAIRILSHEAIVQPMQGKGTMIVNLSEERVSAGEHLQKLASYGDVELVRFLLAREASISAPDVASILHTAYTAQADRNLQISNILHELSLLSSDFSVKIIVTEQATSYRQQAEFDIEDAHKLQELMLPD